MKFVSNEGFTLIELAIVIAIIGILAAVAVPKYGDMNKQVEITGCQEFFQALQTSSSIYLSKTGTPPKIFSDYVTTGVVASPKVLSSKALTDSGHISSITPPDFSSQQVTIVTKSGDNIEFYLNGTDVTSVFPP